MAANQQPDEAREPVLSPVERVCELCFGLFMALTFVGAVSAATAGTEAGTEAGRTMFYTALGCNLAWGLADAVMYLVRTLTDRARRVAVAHAVRAEPDAVSGVLQLRQEMGSVMRTLVSDVELEAVRARLSALPDLPARARLHGADYLAAAGVFALVVLGTMPVALPFLLMETRPALLVSRVLTLVILFACGLALGRHAGGGGWRSGLAMTIVGVALTAAIIALGG
ncbi:VIT1/CCC1 transporter family protein [Ramlibacter sp. USB13]|uniref:VIT1/CCC1 transporter family protein n=1 Tax=Ramlibacter cellulosilyticus TaxID=2764187 RepID=A0A923MUB1_9BURK|nr:VIT1/CCC1 transporter family protein [Ramlibacter cellulosilyticus]MBC5785393.1 VIT1/CCC1 transporter family protein [Ramlibacter cellulosilyticus]